MQTSNKKKHKKAFIVTLLSAAFFSYPTWFLYQLSQSATSDVRLKQDTSDFLLLTQKGQVLTKDHLRRKVTVFLLNPKDQDLLEWSLPSDSDLIFLYFSQKTLNSQEPWEGLKTDSVQTDEMAKMFPLFKGAERTIFALLDQETHLVYWAEKTQEPEKWREKSLQQISKHLFNQKVYAYLQGRTFFGPKKS